MAWIRLDDDYIYHPKFVALSSGAFRLWHEGMAYCRKLLTDGVIPQTALRSFRYAKRSAVDELITPIGTDVAPLWERIESGFLVHDYLVWNKSREQELKDREESKVRASRYRDEQRSIRVTNSVREDVRTVNVRTRIEEGSGSVRKEGSGEKTIEARSKRPIFTGQRVTVFEFMLDDCLNVLGDHADTFDLHAWFFALDAAAVRDGVVVPKRDGGAWLQAQLVAEAQRRGLPLRMASTVAPAGNKRIAGLVAGGEAFLRRNQA